MDYFIEPVKSDCEDILSRFQRTESVRYEEFAAIWRKMDFPSIFYGKMAANEMRAFSRLILTTAYPYLLPPYNFQIRVGGLYLLYGLYYTQLVAPKEKITIALKDWENIMKFQQDAMNSRHYDVCYIFRKLISEKAFYFAAMPKHLYFHVKRKPKRQEVCEEFRDRPARVKELITTETLEEIMNVQEHYEKVKAAVSTTPGQPDPAVNLINKHLGPMVQSTVMEYQNWLDEVAVRKNESGDAAAAADPGEGTSTQGDSSRRAELLASIKSKSYGHLVEASKSRRHRQVELDTSGPEIKQESTRKTIPCLQTRTMKNLISKGKVKEEVMECTRHWRLSVTEQDKSLKRRVKKRFKY
ncbi:snRNA-activating protein complex subunit 1b [Anguilla rostrata]|uniref:snRNA-activating protein complex subunit 1 n=1 Tax=Anguilla anguilla TaxID=7936 RepID=A0A9D3N0N4_ANGAN|nr:snRNA-activating protein complex subunit 1b [Anguilla anguilla]KAG5857718.1 hypothetical protein ANANG_G00022350 [Anguilla anguilla]